jgi:hypothetical protein
LTKRRVRKASLSAIPTFLKCVRERLDQMAGMAKAAEACAEAGNLEKGVEIVFDVEQPIYETGTRLNGASLHIR